MIIGLSIPLGMLQIDTASPPRDGPSVSGLGRLHDRLAPDADRGRRLPAMLEQLRTPGCLSALSRGAAVSGLADSGSDVLTSHAGRARHALGRSAPTGRPSHREGAGHVGAAGPVDRIGLRRVSSPRWWRRSLSFPFRAGCAPCSRCRPPRAPWRFSVGRPRPGSFVLHAADGRHGGARRRVGTAAPRPRGAAAVHDPQRRGDRLDEPAGVGELTQTISRAGNFSSGTSTCPVRTVRWRPWLWTRTFAKIWAERGPGGPSPGGPRSAAAPDLCRRLSRCR